MVDTRSETRLTGGTVTQRGRKYVPSVTSVTIRVECRLPGSASLHDTDQVRDLRLEGPRSVGYGPHQSNVTERERNRCGRHVEASVLRSSTSGLDVGRRRFRQMRGPPVPTLGPVTETVDVPLRSAQGTAPTPLPPSTSNLTGTDSFLRDLVEPVTATGPTAPSVTLLRHRTRGELISVSRVGRVGTEDTLESRTKERRILGVRTLQTTYSFPF